MWCGLCHKHGHITLGATPQRRQVLGLISSIFYFLLGAGRILSWAIRQEAEVVSAWGTLPVRGCRARPSGRAGRRKGGGERGLKAQQQQRAFLPAFPIAFVTHEVMR